MKKSLIFLLVFFLVACTSDKEDIVDNNQNIENTSAESSIPQLISFAFIASDNPEELVEDVEGSIIGDSIIECWCRHLMKIPYL